MIIKKAEERKIMSEQKSMIFKANKKKKIMGTKSWLFEMLNKNNKFVFRLITKTEKHTNFQCQE